MRHAESSLNAAFLRERTWGLGAVSRVRSSSSVSSACTIVQRSSTTISLRASAASSDVAGVLDEWRVLTCRSRAAGAGPNMPSEHGAATFDSSRNKEL